MGDAVKEGMSRDNQPLLLYFVGRFTQKNVSKTQGGICPISMMDRCWSAELTHASYYVRYPGDGVGKIHPNFAPESAWVFNPQEKQQRGYGFKIWSEVQQPSKLRSSTVFFGVFFYR